MATERIFSFANCSVNQAQRELKVDGKLCLVPPRIFDFIVYLIVHRDRTVDVNELMQSVWQKSQVSRSAIHRALMLARKALGDDAKKQRFIRTINKIGFRFIADITEPVRTMTADISRSGNTSFELNTLRTIALFEFENSDRLAAYSAFWILFGMLHLELGAAVITTPQLLATLGLAVPSGPSLDRLSVVRGTLNPEWIVEGKIERYGQQHRIEMAITGRHILTHHACAISESLLDAIFQAGRLVVAKILELL